MATMLPISPPLGNVTATPLHAQQSAAPTVAVSPQAVQPVNAGDTRNATRSSSDELKGAVEKVSKAVSGYTSELNFSIDQDLGVTVVKVIDKQSDQVIRQIPSEEMLSIAKGLDKVLGVLFEQQV